MKGSDVTSEQLVEAEAFLRVPAGDQADRDPILLARKDLLRLLAWYGEIRAEGARRGISRGIPVTIPTPEQLADMPMPQPLSKVAAARRKIDKDARDKERS